MKCKYCTTDEKYRPGEWVDGYCPVCQQNILRLRAFNREQERINTTQRAYELPQHPGFKFLQGKNSESFKEMRSIENN